MKIKKILSIFLAVLIILITSWVPLVISAVEVSGEYTFEILNGTYCKITSYSGNETEIDMPEELNGYIVQSLNTLAKYSFAGCDGLVNIKDIVALKKMLIAK